MKVEIKLDMKSLERAFSDLENEQLPFAKVMTLTLLAKGAAADESLGITETFGDNVRPTTKSAFYSQSATKDNLVAIVGIKNVQHQVDYLAPYVDGGMQWLGTKKGLLTPKGAGTDKNGNLRRNALAQMKAKPGVFIGAVQTKGGEVRGVWQRMGPQPIAGRHRGKAKGGLRPKAKLKLLIRFSDPLPVKEHLPFEERGQRFVERNAQRIFDEALARAVSTRKPR